jgi:thioredoxin reductase (NADPH)
MDPSTDTDAAADADAAASSGGPPPGGSSPRLDLAVVGAGPCGIAVGVAADHAGLRCKLFDEGPLTASIVDYPPYMTFFSTAGNLEIGDVPFVVARGKPGREDALAYYRRVAEHHDLDVHQHEEVLEVDGGAGSFRLRTRTREGGARTYDAARIVVATGSFHEPNLLDVPGEELDKVKHYYDEPQPYWDQDVVVVGGGNSAVEAALELWRAGARVTFVHFEDGLDPGVKPWVLPDIENRFEEGSIPVRWRTRVDRIAPGSVTLRDVETGETERIRNDWVFAMTGWHADPRLLRELGVHVDPESGVPRHDPETMETDVPGVFIAGVLAAGNDANRIFIENGKHHGRKIVARVTEGRLAT